MDAAAAGGVTRMTTRDRELGALRACRCARRVPVVFNRSGIGTAHAGVLRGTRVRPPSPPGVVVSDETGGLPVLAGAQPSGQSSSRQAASQNIHS